jgi:hypothetical protein
MTPARNRRCAATGDSISTVQLLVEAIAAVIYSEFMTGWCK